MWQLRPGEGRVVEGGADGERAAGRGRGRGQPAAVRRGRLRRGAPRRHRRVLPPREQPLDRDRAHGAGAQRSRSVHHPPACFFLLSTYIYALYPAA